MQDNIVYKLELTSEEYKHIEKAKQEYYLKLSKMTKEQRLQYFKDEFLIELTFQNDTVRLYPSQLFNGNCLLSSVLGVKSVPKGAAAAPVLTFLFFKFP